MAEPDHEGFAARLRALRARAGLSVRELADRADISPTYLRVLEKGANPNTDKPSRPSAPHAERLGRELDDGGDLLRLAGWERDETATAEPAAPRRAAPGSNVADLMKDLRSAVRELGGRTAFMYERALDRLYEFVAEFRRLAAGTLDCDPDDEPHVTRLAVLSCEDHLRAVSYDDGAWWGESLGEKYRETHVDLLRLRPDVDITRIFLVDRDEVATVASTLRWHLELGITTYVLYLDEVHERRHEDFILVDRRLLRTAGPASDAKKSARFTDDRNLFHEKFVAFDNLRRLAIETRGALASIEDIERVIAP